MCDHDSRALARRTFQCRAWDLGVALDWAADRARAKGFAGHAAARILTFDKTDDKDAVLIARLTGQLRYIPEPWTRCGAGCDTALARRTLGRLTRFREPHF